MKDFKYYQNKLPYNSDKRYHTTVYVYRRGELIWSGTPAQWEATQEHSPKQFANAVVERYVDQEAIQKHRDAYHAEEKRLYDEFQRDLIRFHGLNPDSPQAQRAFQLAWDEGHSDGHAQVANCFRRYAEVLATPA